MKRENDSFNYSEVYLGESGHQSEKQLFFPSEKSLEHNQPADSKSLPYSSCLVDHSGRQFVCFHDHCLERNACFKNELPDEIFDFQEMLFHPDDKALLCQQIFPDILKFMEQIPAAEHAEYRFSFNHRYIRKDGSISQFLQEGTISVSDDTDLPVLNLRVFTEIGDFKTDDTMILSILRYSADQGYQKLCTKVYGYNDHSQLSAREREIIRLCHEGLSSKMIADKLNLSIHTVKNHKRNCMEKTLTHNITELIHLCLMSHWL